MDNADAILKKITSPHQLRRMKMEDLDQLAEELRENVIKVVSRRGGHLASNLGIAELTIALHYVFDFSRDRLLWDVGHQCYPHKMLTGRFENFDTLRQADGISGFPAPGESVYDLMATGHAGTAISTASGLALADQLSGRDRHVVSVVGDGSIVNGLSLEAINNLSLLKRQFLVILNDNSMAIDRTTGGLATVLNRVRMTNAYSDLKQQAESLLTHLPLGGEIAEALRHLKEGIRTTLLGNRVFEAMGISYFGPIDGHDTAGLIKVLQRLARVPRPVLLHVHTEKGRGCEYAVEDPCRFHSPPAWTLQEGKAVFPEKGHPNWTEIFSNSLVELAASDERVVAITAAMPDGTGLVEFRKRFPDRYIDVGICESHAVGLAAGLAKGGLRPVVAIYSTFMQRAFDQVFHELSLQNLPVLICMDRAGLVGSDGAVHHGATDIAFMRPLPGMVLMAPAEARELPSAMKLAMSLDGPSAIRYPRDEVVEDLPGPCPAFELGRSRPVRNGTDGTFLCYGTIMEQALSAADALQRQGHSIGVVNARFAKPLDATAISRLIAAGRPVVTCEDHALAGGFGSAVLEMAASRGLDASNVRVLALPDRFIAHASRSQQLAETGLDADGLAAAMNAMLTAAGARGAAKSAGR